MIINQFGNCDIGENMRDPFDCAPYYGRSKKGTFFVGYESDKTEMFETADFARSFIENIMSAKLKAAREYSQAVDRNSGSAPAFVQEDQSPVSLMEEKNAYQRMNCGGIDVLNAILNIHKRLTAPSATPDAPSGPPSQAPPSTDDPYAEPKRK
jgi:hypothetical protein